MAVYGVGIDLSDVRRIRSILAGPRGARFVRRVFTDRERETCERRRDPAECFAARFAAKEAFKKALGAPAGMRWREMEVVRDARGAPSLELFDDVAALLRDRGITRCHLSMTHDGDTAAAVVVLEG